MSKLYKTSTTDLKALYDFSVIYAEITTQTANRKSPEKGKIAISQRDTLYNELVKRVEKEAFRLKTGIK